MVNKFGQVSKTANGKKNVGQVNKTAKRPYNLVKLAKEQNGEKMVKY